MDIPDMPDVPAMPDVNATVVDNPALARFEILVDGEVVGFAEYIASGDRMNMHHTEVHPEHGERGLATMLIRTALDQIRARALRVVPTCSFVKHFIAAHPEYQDLVA